MRLREVAEEAGFSVRERAEEAGWSMRERAREAAWTFQERVLWPGADAARKALSLARRALEPLHRLIQTKLAWPLSDRLGDYGIATRTAIATTLVIAATAASLAGVRIAASDPQPGGAGAGTLVAEGAPETAVSGALSGITPDFESAPAESAAAGADTGTVASQAVPPKAKAPAAGDPAPARVAWDFAQAFVRYEVGKADEKTASTFASIADKPLAEALSEEPPRLPESADVPKAEVLNVVLGEREGKKLEVSVSLLRLRAASELRLTLRETPKGWQVVEVRG